MSEKDTHEPEQNVTQPARRTKKKKRGKAGRIVRKTVKSVVVLAVIAGAGLFGLKAYIQKQAESSDSESYSRAVVTRGAMEEPFTAQARPPRAIRQMCSRARTAR